MFGTSILLIRLHSLGLDSRIVLFLKGNGARGIDGGRSYSLCSNDNFLTPWPESASELYRPSDCRFSTNLMPNFTDRHHVVNVTDPYSRIFWFLY
jgi:hypothetical protein